MSWSFFFWFLTCSIPWTNMFFAMEPIVRSYPAMDTAPSRCDDVHAPPATPWNVINSGDCGTTRAQESGEIIAKWKNDYGYVIHDEDEKINGWWFLIKYGHEFPNWWSFFPDEEIYGKLISQNGMISPLRIESHLLTSLYHIGGNRILQRNEKGSDQVALHGLLSKTASDRGNLALILWRWRCAALPDLSSGRKFQKHREDISHHITHTHTALYIYIYICMHIYI